MAAVIAGWVAGYAMALVTTAAFTYLATRNRAGSVIDRWISADVPTALLAVAVSVGSMVVWTLVGLIVGSVYEVGGLSAQRNALGSPSLPFSVVMVILGLFPLFPLAVLAPRHWRLWLVMSGSFAALFGWLMPVLAGR